jgi:hypothetical protein
MKRKANARWRDELWLFRWIERHVQGECKSEGGGGVAVGAEWGQQDNNSNCVLDI